MEHSVPLEGLPVTGERFGGVISEFDRGERVTVETKPHHKQMQRLIVRDYRF